MISILKYKLNNYKNSFIAYLINDKKKIIQHTIPKINKNYEFISYDKGCNLKLSID